MRSIAGDTPNPVEATKKISELAEVSLQAAAIRVVTCLPSGYVFAQVSDGSVISSGRSLDTVASQPAVGTPIDELFPSAGHVWKGNLGGRRYIWWQFDEARELPSVDETGDWRDVLSEIVTAIGIRTKDVPKFKARVNGIVAFANGQVKAKRSKRQSTPLVCRGSKVLRLRITEYLDC
jgi:hypothetical protein